MSKAHLALFVTAAVLTAAAPARAQNPPAGRDSAAARSAAAAGDSARDAAPASDAGALRAAWLSDRVPLRVGDIVTVVVDEQTAAREHVSQVATGDHSLRAGLNAGITNADARLGPNKEFGSDLRSGSRDIGDASRAGDLTAVLTVRVTAIAPNGVAQIEGSKQVSVDGRVQNVALKGYVRPEDVSSANVVRSERIADAVITYKGKKIGPRVGIAGKILAMLWP
jgi:flagellar L-ring protein precursor FlgH